jgi:hypothetical protein
MTKLQAINSFLSSFGIPAYEENAIYAADTVLPLPYITYGIQLDNYRGGERPLLATAWYRTTTLKPLEDIQTAIAQRIGISGIVIPCDGGYVWIKRGTPFAQFLDDPSDKFVKRVIFNLLVEYNTAI